MEEILKSTQGRQGSFSRERERERESSYKRRVLQIENNKD